MMCHIKRLGGDKRAAVAPTVALSLFALIGAGGLAFDYARMASLDTELQNAADQAALAAATQLDQETGAIARATAAAQGLLNNQTLFANDSDADGMLVTVPTILFYANKSDAEAVDGTDCPTTGAVTADDEARFVCVRTANRTARFALTPVVAAFSSGNLSAMAVAGLGSSICKTPPVMICNPQETSTELDFDASGLIGVGLRLVSVGGGSGSWAPGNFGYLDSNGGSNGAPGLREALGWGTPPGDCIAQSGVDTKPGATVTVTGALNTRFDIYDSSTDCPAGGSCGASINSVKDLVRSANANGGNKCRIHNQGWGLPTDYYGSTSTIPSSATVPLATSITPSAMGHPRDMCHAVDSAVSGFCSGPIGDGLWDRAAYFRTNYVRGDGTRWTDAEWQTNTGLSSTATRYEVYKWEYEHRGDLIDGVTVLDPNPAGATGNTKVAYGLPQCSSVEGYGSGIEPDDDTPDRRRISVAVVNCVAESVNGNETNLAVVKWIDVFLVEPSLNRARTNAGDVYAEVIGETQTGAGATAGQVVRRDVPYLVK
jgi:Flp pilus assembly protein TadG